MAEKIYGDIGFCSSTIMFWKRVTQYMMPLMQHRRWWDLLASGILPLTKDGMRLIPNTRVWDYLGIGVSCGYTATETFIYPMGGHE